ncbi:MAG: hypothetical protein KQJ78_19520 [Deltaproteobacteria bacterium]|nr:hypothetical protein [Deltaproteobacteria bacterium]
MEKSDIKPGRIYQASSRSFPRKVLEIFDGPSFKRRGMRMMVRYCHVFPGGAEGLVYVALLSDFAKWAREEWKP